MPRKKKVVKKKNPNRVASMNANRLVSVNLKMRHSVNGASYGPGKLKLPYNLAAGLLHTENQAGLVEEQFHGTKAVIIGPRARTGGVTTKQVPIETFDTEYVNALPASIVSGAGMQDTGKGSSI